MFALLNVLAEMNLKQSLLRKSSKLIFVLNVTRSLPEDRNSLIQADELTVSTEDLMLQNNLKRTRRNRLMMITAFFRYVFKEVFGFWII